MKFALLFILLAGAAPLAAAEQKNATSLRVMTYNIRYAGWEGANSWPKRRPIMKECIQEANPDLFGTQEGVYRQLKQLAADLPEYQWIGLGRDGGSRGEFMAVFYKPERFEPLEYDHFWLSDTPDVIGSTTWGNSNRRMVTWVRFLDQNSNQEFYFFNTHFDHQIQPAREKSADLVRARVENLKTDLPVILVGDFNAVAEKNPVYETLVSNGPFTDAWTAASERINEDWNTFNGFRPGPAMGGARIDWILYQGAFTVSRAETMTCSADDQWPSDHFPVIADMRFETK